jgi:deoxyadenosine/deoxycytidine kinase
MRKIITLAGIIGIGKTSLLKAINNYIAQHELQEQYMTLEEFIPNNLPNFYEDVLRDNKPTVAYRLQKQLMLERHTELFLAQQANPNKVIICDGGVWLDRAYATNLWLLGYMTDAEFASYKRCAKGVIDDIFNYDKVQHKIIYLANMNGALERINHRNRAGENLITIEYLKGLDKAIIGQIPEYNKESFVIYNDYDCKDYFLINKIIEKDIINHGRI